MSAVRDKLAIEMGAAIRASRQQKAWSQEKLAARAKTTRQTISALENDGSGTIDTLLRVVGALGLKELPGGIRMSPGDQAATRADLHEIKRAIDDVVMSASAASRLLTHKVPKRILDYAIEPPSGESASANVLTFPDRGLRITLAEEEEQIEGLRRAFASSPDAEWRKPFRGKNKYMVPRGIDAAAGLGAELLTPTEEEEQLREIPEHYWEERGARMVLRARGNSLILRGIVDRDLLFIRPTAAPTNGNIIACRINALAFVKIFEKTGEKVRLKSANPQFGPIEVGPDDSFHCFGVVVGRSGYGLATAEDL
jgi:SOS-response transcriptional repressor LexA